MLFFFSFVTLAFCMNDFPQNEFVTITSYEDNSFMISLIGESIRLVEVKKKVFEENDKNIAKIVPRDGGFEIKFAKMWIYKKSQDPGVVGRTFEDNDPGFIFDIKKSKLGGYTIKSRGKCLEVRSKATSPDGFFVNGQPCDDNKKKQVFQIMRANMRRLDPSSNLLNNTTDGLEYTHLKSYKVFQGNNNAGKVFAGRHPCDFVHLNVY